MQLLSSSAAVSFFLVTCAACADPNKGVHPPATATQADAKQGDPELTFAKVATAPSIAADQAGLATWYGGAFTGKKGAGRFIKRATADYARMA